MAKVSILFRTAEEAERFYKNAVEQMGVYVKYPDHYEWVAAPVVFLDGRNFYPDMPPRLESETDDQYADRLTGADGTDRVPYNHHRLRSCSLGWHSSCSTNTSLAADDCECPCH